jgi:putative transposase
MIRSRALLVAIGIDWQDWRQLLGMEMANRESSTSWKGFVLGLKRRGLRGVVFGVSDDHPLAQAGQYRSAFRGVLAALLCAFSAQCAGLPARKVADDCLIELRCLYDRRNAEEAHGDLTAWLLRWQESIRASVGGSKRTLKKR